MRADDIIAEALDYLDDPDQTVHTQEKMLRALNRALSRISTRSRSIAVNRFHAVVADQYEYSLPVGTLEIKRARYAHTPQSPPLKRRRYSYVETIARGYPGIPRYYAFSQRAGTERGTGAVREVTTNQNFQIDGSNIAGAKPSDILINLTATLPEASIFEISSLADPQNAEEEAALQVVTLDAIGGSGRGVQVGDTIRIVSPDTQGFSIAIAPRPSVSDSVGVESLSSFLVMRHPEITQTLIDNENDELSIDPDLEDMALYETLHWASLSGESRDAADYWKARSNQEFEDNITNVRERVAQSLSAWDTNYGYGGLNESTTLKDAASSFNDYTVV